MQRYAVRTSDPCSRTVPSAVRVRSARLCLYPPEPAAASLNTHFQQFQPSASLAVTPSTSPAFFDEVSARLAVPPERHATSRSQPSPMFPRAGQQLGRLMDNPQEEAAKLAVGRTREGDEGLARGCNPHGLEWRSTAEETMVATPKGASACGGEGAGRNAGRATTWR